MFLTHQLTPAETLSELLSLRGYSTSETECFQSLRHNDHLCPGFQERADVMLDAYKRHRMSAHDVQGPRDDGVDVLITYEVGEEEHRIGLQIKSFSEIEAWRTKSDKEFILRLKAQHSTAVSKLRVDDYYLLLCTDATVHQKQIRTICSELKDFQTLTIVRPSAALAFYNLSDIEIQALVTSLLCKEDSVLEAAKEAVRDMPDDLAYLIIGIVCRAFEGSLRLTQEDLFELYAEWQEIDQDAEAGSDRLSELLWTMDSQGLSAIEDYFEINIPDLPAALCAIYFDLKQRRPGDMRLGIATMLGVNKNKFSRRRKPRRGRRT